jgi:hypothetical protein
MSFIRSPTRKGKGTIMIYTKRFILSFPKEVVTVVYLGYLGIEKDFPEQISALPCKKKRNQEE